jgi:hypothetical protein
MIVLTMSGCERRLDFLPRFFILHLVQLFHFSEKGKRSELLNVKKYRCYLACIKITRAH